MALLRYIVLLNTDVPRSARFYAHGLGLAVTVCSERWAELQSGAFKIALMQAPKGTDPPSRGYSPFLSFDTDDMESTVTRLLSMGAELDGSIKYAPHGKVAAVRCLDGHMLGLFEPAEGIPKAEENIKPASPAPKSRPKDGKQWEGSQQVKGADSYLMKVFCAHAGKGPKRGWSFIHNLSAL